MGPHPIKPMRFDVALVCAGVLSLLGFPAQSNQMFRAGGSSGTSCPSGSQYRGSGFCRATKPNYQFFRAGGSSGTSCPSGSQYRGNDFCLARCAGLRAIPSKGVARAGITTNSLARPMRLKILARIGRAVARDLYGRDSRGQLLHHC